MSVIYFDITILMEAVTKVLLANNSRRIEDHGKIAYFCDSLRCKFYRIKFGLFTLRISGVGV